MLLHLLRLLVALLLPRGCVWQSGERRFLLVVPIAITLTVFLLSARFNIVLFRVRKIDPLFRALPTQIRETGELREDITATAAIRGVVLCAGM